MKIFAIGLTALTLAATPGLAQEINDPASTAGVLKARQEEAAVIRHFPSIARRDGNVLTISRAGRPVARLTDSGIQHCDGAGTCNVWRFTGMITLQTGPGRHEAYAEVAYLDGESAEVMLIDANGAGTWMGGDPLASPDGLYVAAGQTAGVDDGGLVITDWSRPGHRTQAAFNSPCAPVEWRGATTFSVICSRTDDARNYKFSYVLGTVHQTAPGAWRLDETDIVDDYLTRRPARDLGFKPQSETARFTAAPAISAKDAAAQEAHNRENGFERLN